LTPKGAEIAKGMGAERIADDILMGWQAFARLAPPGAVRLIRELRSDFSPMTRALRKLPTKLLHGDLKLDNIGIEPSGRIWLIDWAMSLTAPAAIELGWFMAVNSQRLATSLDEILAIYAREANLSPLVRDRHDALAALCGLLLRGWRKALDARDGKPEELAWWCDRIRHAECFL